MENKEKKRYIVLFASLLSYPKEDIKDVAAECIKHSAAAPSTQKTRLRRWRFFQISLAGAAR